MFMLQRAYGEAVTAAKAPMNINNSLSSLLEQYRHRTPAIIIHYMGLLLLSVRPNKIDIINTILLILDPLQDFKTTCLPKSMAFQFKSDNWHYYCGSHRSRVSGLAVFYNWSIITNPSLGLNLTVAEFHMTHLGDWYCQYNDMNTFSVWKNESKPFGVFCGSHPLWLMIIKSGKVLLFLDTTFYADYVNICLYHHALICSENINDGQDWLQMSLEMYPVYKVDETYNQLLRVVFTNKVHLRLPPSQRELLALDMQSIIQSHVLVRGPTYFAMHLKEIEVRTDTETVVKVFDGPSPMLPSLVVLYCPPKHNYTHMMLEKYTSTLQMYIIMACSALKKNEGVLITYLSSNKVSPTMIRSNRSLT